MTTQSFCLLTLLVSLSASCSSKDDGDAPSLGGNTSGAGPISNGGDAASGGFGDVPLPRGGTSGNGASGGVEIVVPVSGAGGKSTTMPGEGNGMLESCDGLDNDENGIIDDVDAGGDGVCDCLNIATLGDIGPWSNGGNIFATWLDARSPQGAISLGDQTLTPELLAPFQVIVTLHVATTEIANGSRLSRANHVYSDAEVEAFQAWVRRGGGVMTTTGYTFNEAEEVTNVNRLLAPLGAGYSTTHLDLTGFVTHWEPHPVTEGVKNIYTDNGAEPGGMGMTVARGGGDGVALQVTQADQGRVIVWGDEWITYDSEWQDVKDQQVELFWLNILKWLSPANQCQVPIPPSVPH